MKEGEHLASVLPWAELREIRSGRMERKLQKPLPNSEKQSSVEQSLMGSKGCPLLKSYTTRLDNALENVM